jgi:hypothetical protein
MTRSYTGDPTRAPYRRLCVLKGLKGLAYEAPDPNNIVTTAAEIVGDGPINGTQMVRILKKLQNEGLAAFSLDASDWSSYNAWQDTVYITNLDQKKLDRLIKQTRRQVNQTPPLLRRVLHKPSPPRLRGFSKRHPIVKGIDCRCARDSNRRFSRRYSDTIEQNLLSAPCAP